MKRVAAIAILVIAALAITACGNGEESAPVLAPLPTRTPVPATPTAEPSAPAPVAATEVIDLSVALGAFLDAAQTISPLERSIAFDEYVTRSHPECATITLFPGSQLVQMLDQAGLDLVRADLDAWQQAIADFPAESVRAEVQAEMARVAELLPPAPGDPSPRICLLPVPPWPEHGDLPEATAGAQTLGPDLILVWCAAGAQCAEMLRPSLAYHAAYAYQIAASGLTMETMTLLDMALVHGRAADVALALHPDAAFDWQVTLEPAVEAELWSRMRDYLGTTYQDYPDYRKIERFLYGRETGEYPAMGGLYIGLQIVRAYHLAHPEVSYAALARMSAPDVLAASGYAPG